jgi:hypothetical protein
LEAILALGNATVFSSIQYPLVWDRIKISTNNDEPQEQSEESSEEDKETVELEFDIETPCCGPSRCHTEAGCGLHTAQSFGKAVACILSRFQNVCLG